MSPATIALTIAAVGRRLPAEVWDPATIAHAGLHGASDQLRPEGCDRCAGWALQSLLRRVRVTPSVRP